MALGGAPFRPRLREIVRDGISFGTPPCRRPMSSGLATPPRTITSWPRPRRT